MNKKTLKEWVIPGLTFGLLYVLPIGAINAIHDSRIFTRRNGEVIALSQSRIDNSMMMYQGSGFAGKRWFDNNNDGKLDDARTEVVTGRRYSLGNHTITKEEQKLYADMREEYMHEKMEQTRLKKLTNIVHDSYAR